MAQHDYDIANQSGAAFRSDLNNALDAIVTTNSGATEPATTFAFQFWADTTANQLKMRNAANDGWIVILETDGEVPAKTFTGDITLNAQSDVRFGDSDSSNFISFQAAGTVGSDVTFTLPDADGSANHVLKTNGSGVLSFAAEVGGDITDTAPERLFTNTTEEDTDGGRESKITFKGEQSGGEVSTLAQIEASHDGTSDDEKGKIIFRTNDGSDGSSPTSRVEIDSQGKFFIGDFGEPSNKNSVTPSFILSANGVSGAAQITRHTSVGGGGALLELSATRGTSNTDHTVLQNGDGIGTVDFLGADGNEFVTAASIQGQVDGTPGDNDMPGRLLFSTTADGTASPVERMRITNLGMLKAANDGDYSSASATYHEFNNTYDAATLLLRAKNNSFSQFNIRTGCYRTANSAWSVLRAESGDGSTNAFVDVEFNLRGDGNAFADGTWSGGGADYAEYFEWSDSNPNEEDRRGISVVLDGDKIREAQEGEDPIGVISGNPSVVGDAAWNKWSGKYLRDEFGTYIQEDYEVVNDEGETVVQQRRKLSLDYDPNQEYIPREQRPEWDCVGLMGKLRIRKGQATGSRWIKMRDISDSVEEWLVR